MERFLSRDASGGYPSPKLAPGVSRRVSMKCCINTWVYHHHQVSFQRITEMEPEELAVSVRRAEQIMLPIIQELKPSAGASLFLLAQYTQVLVTGTDALTLESAKAISSAILALWEAGYYIPCPDYPFTLQETLQVLEEGLFARRDDADAFQPWTPVEGVPPSAMDQVAEGIVTHPETALWHISLMVNGPCVSSRAYQDELAGTLFERDDTKDELEGNLDAWLEAAHDNREAAPHE